MQLNQSGISVIWVIFAVFFGILSWCHFDASKRAIPPFQRTPRPWGESGKLELMGSDIDEPLDAFVKDFNGYLVKQNAASRKANKRAGWGYALAALTALFSLALQRQEPCNLGRTPQQGEEASE